MIHIALMQDVHLQRLDLNLLVALDALIAERNVTRAAERLGLSQPAVSHALARLRKALGDPLLVRAPRGMELTPRAQAIAAPLARALGDIAAAVARRRRSTLPAPPAASGSPPTITSNAFYCRSCLPASGGRDPASTSR